MKAVLSNKDKIIEELHRNGMKIGCWDEKLNQLNQANLKKVLHGMRFEEDTDVSINRKKHVVEIDVMDNEIDFAVLTKEEYISRYGDERYS